MFVIKVYPDDRQIAIISISGDARTFVIVLPSSINGDNRAVYLYNTFSLIGLNRVKLVSL